MEKYVKQLAAFVLIGVCSIPRFVLANSPAQQIQETIQHVLGVVNSPAGGNQTDRQRALRESIMPRFDWPEMAKQALGKHWDSAGARRSEFISVFADFLGNTYIGKIGSYKDEKVLFVEETVNDNVAEVKTKIVANKGDSTSVNYQLRQVQGEWKIYDVVVEDISLVVNYRAQFNRILSRGNFDDLLKQLKEKGPTPKN